MGLTTAELNGSPNEQPTRDEGTVLVLTLLLTVVLAAIVLALATFATTGLKTSRVTTDLTEANAAASAGANWAIEELAKKQIAPENTVDCDATPVDLGAPAGLFGSEIAALDVTCTTQAEIDDHPVVLLTAVATTVDGMTRTVDAVIQVPRADYTAQVHSWTTG